MPKKHIVEEYQLSIIEGSSPFTKRPTTQYRMAAVGILKRHGCDDRIITEPQEPISNPVDSPVIGNPPLGECEFYVHPDESTVKVGGIVKFELGHENNSGINSITATYPVGKIQQISETEFRVLEEGTYEISYEVEYGNGQVCGYTVNVTGTTPKCGFTATPQGGTTKKTVGDKFIIELDHGQNSGATNDIEFQVEAIEGDKEAVTVNKVDGGYEVTSTKQGKFSIDFTVTYGADDLVCTDSILLEWIDEPPNEKTIIVCPSETVEVGRFTITETNRNYANPLTIGMRFSTLTGADFPDLTVEAPNGDTFGYTKMFLTGGSQGETTASSACSKAEYTGFAPPGGDEEFVFHDPMLGEWVFYALNLGGSEKSEVTFYINEGLDIEVTYSKPNC